MTELRKWHYRHRVTAHTLSPLVKIAQLRLVHFNACKFYLKKMEFKNLSERWGKDEVRDKVRMADVDHC